MELSQLAQQWNETVALMRQADAPLEFLIPLVIAMMVLCVTLPMLVPVLSAVYYTIRHRLKGKRKMGKKQRRACQKTMLADGISALILDLHAKDVMTAHEANEWHTKFAKAHGMWELMSRKVYPKPIPAPQLIAEIKFRLKTGIVGPLKSIPGEPPPKITKSETKAEPSSLTGKLQVLVLRKATA